jgi:mono/diheme cytochrome c family protein
MSKRSTAVWVAAAALLTGAAAGACTARPTSAASTPPAQRGEYLVRVGGCNDCHTPLKMGPKGPEPDMSRMLSGHPEAFVIGEPNSPPNDRWLMLAAATGTAFSGPWGVSFAANLTPDQNTGLGIWTEDMFVKALRTGRHMGVSREILPPMPWPNVAAMTDDDIKAVFAYLRSIEPIHNRVPDPLPPVPLQTAASAPTSTAVTR